MHSDDVGVGQTNHVGFNTGSETIPHLLGKALVGYIGLQNGYRVDSEVPVSEGSIDMLLWGHKYRHTIAVELETSPTEQTIESKLTRYVQRNQTIDDMLVINVGDIPVDMIEAAQFISNELGLEL